MFGRSIVVLAALAALVATFGQVGADGSDGLERTAAPVSAERVAGSGRADLPERAQDPRRRLGLFVDPVMQAATQGEAIYRNRIGQVPQAFWIIPEEYPTSSVRWDVRAYTSRALDARKTPMVVVYGIPGRDCGSHSSAGSLETAAEYRAWIRQVARGLEGQKALLVLEPDALPLFSSEWSPCPTERAGWEDMLRYATKTLARSGTWVYLDAGHSNWTTCGSQCYGDRPAVLKRAGVKFARGISTNVSNFRPTSDEHAYAKKMLAELRALGVRGKRYVIDTSRNGNPAPSDDVLNPTWAWLGKPPKLRFQGAFDGTLWVKHPGESDGEVNGGPRSGQWCDFLADRLLRRSESNSCG